MLLLQTLALLVLYSLASAGPVHSPVQVTVHNTSDIIKGHYIVSMKTATNETALLHAMNKSDTVHHVYRAGSFKGFAGRLNSTQVAQLRNHSAVASVEPDRIVTRQQLLVQSQAIWNLARISHKSSGTNYAYNYIYDTSAASGTCAYVIDSGIMISHPEFEGRASFVQNFIDNSTTDDCGHGTHVAGTIGSKTYGVAKSIKLFAVKVLDATGTGSLSGVIAGIQWAAQDATNARKDGRCPKGTVANLSLGTSPSSALDSAVQSAVSSGLFLAVAAGNSGTSASQSSPARAPNACTAAAIDETNTRASFSNYGSAVKVYAPGVDVVSTWNNGGTAVASGTSMASPHVAGLAAYFMGASFVTSTSKTGPSLCAYIQKQAVQKVVKDSSQSASGDLLAYNYDNY